MVLGVGAFEHGCVGVRQYGLGWVLRSCRMDGFDRFRQRVERERLLSKRDEDHEEHKEAIAKGNAIFNDVTCDIDEREAARKMVKNLKSIAKADDDTFDKAVRKELLRDE